VLALLGLSVLVTGCGSPSGPSDPGSGVHAEFVSHTVFLGNCLADLANCVGEISPAGDVFGGSRYNVPIGDLVTVRACINHPKLPSRDLYIDMTRRPSSVAGTQSTVQPEENTPSPICVGAVYQAALGTACVGNGGISIREYRRNKEEDALFICGVDAGNGYIRCGSSEMSICLVGVR
jgi:hypothetical protein